MKQDVDSILLANWYFTKCKIEGNSCAKKTELARKYLVTKIQKALFEREISQSNKAIFILNNVEIK
jgi:hypothetical protein